MEKKKNKKNKIDKEVSELKETSETKEKKSVALSKKAEKKEKVKVKEISKASVSKKNNNNEEKKVSWNPFTKEGQYSIKVWFQGLKSELCKIIWPTKPLLITYTIVVLVTLITVSIYLYSLGLFFGEIFKRAGIV